LFFILLCESLEQEKAGMKMSGRAVHGGIEAILVDENC